MAHAAVVSLMHTLEQIRHGDGVSDPDENQLLEPLLRKLSLLLDFLEESSQSSRKEVTSLERKIRVAAYRAEDVIESRISDRLLSKSQNLYQKIRVAAYHAEDVFESHLLSAEKYHLDLQKIMTEIDSIIEEVREIQEVRGEQNLQPKNFSPSRPAPSGQTTMVGFDQDLKQIRDRVCDERQSLQIVPIIGMGGMGKTTLTMNVYNDPYVKYRFDIRAWVTFSQQYRMRDILLSLLNDVVTDKIPKEDDAILKEHVYKNLRGNRYLIVVDDIWSIDAWIDIKMLFPNDNNGSRIILTSRLKDVADYVNSSDAFHQMRFLNEEESWDLLLEKAFGKANCPLGLVDVGKKIAKNCQGLPLLIVVIGGLLSKVNQPKDFWEYVAENLSSIVAEKDAQCLEILSLSYKYLSAHLKACFLYMGVFPENYEISVSRLIKLWVAEGFIKPNGSKQLEEVAREYLGDLIDRNLILVRQKGSINGKVKVKTCIMHGLLRNLCVQMAHKEEFLCVKSRYLHVFSEENASLRRLSIHDDASCSPDEEDMTMQSMSLVRSFVYTGWDDTQLHSYYYFGCRLLRVLDMVGVELIKFPNEILQLVNLRYIAITCRDEIPPSIALLKNLLTLVVENPWGLTIHLPEEVLNMPQLRHLKLSRVSLLPGLSSPLTDSDKSFVLENLETLSNVQDFGMGEHFFEKIPNVKKLGIYSTNTWAAKDIHLQKLETLKIICETPTNSFFLRSITSAPRLKKITLEHSRLDWEYMMIFGILPNLEVLKLLEFAFVGPEWIPTEGEFLKLKFLLIRETSLEQWTADSTHFPRLEHLILQKCSNLVEIPSDIGEIQTLEIIEIDNSSPSCVKSAKDILEEQRNQGNEVLQVLFHQTKKRLYPLKYGIQQDESGHFHRRETKLDRLRKESDDPSGSNPRSEVMGSLMATGGDYPERVGQPVCQYYMRTGTCKYGASCKYHHPSQGGRSSGSVTLNFDGYPLQAGAINCSYYAKYGLCKFGTTCKFNHPHPSGLQTPIPAREPGALPTPATVPTHVVYPTPCVQSSQQYGIFPGNWPVARPAVFPPSYVSGTYGYMLPPPGVVPGPGWTPYPSSVSRPFYGITQSATAYTRVTGPFVSITSAGLSGSSRQEHAFPERPGQPECQYYLRTGECKYGPKCKYHHPTEWNPATRNYVLSPMGLPLRPGAPVCINYSQNAVCQYGPLCRFDHPMK